MDIKLPAEQVQVLQSLTAAIERLAAAIEANNAKKVP